MAHAHRLSTAEAAARLGVKPETVYAYVSRGLLARQRTPAGSTFDAREVERLAQTARVTSRTARPDRPLAFVTELTLIEDGHLYYRGRDAVALAGSAPFESVAEWLWTGQWPPGTPAWPAPPPAALEAATAAVAALPAGATTLARLSAATVAAGSADPMRHDRTPLGVAVVGRQLIGCMVAALGVPAGGPRRGLAAAPGVPGSAEPVAAAVARTLSAAAGASLEPREAGTVEEVVGAALVLMADHELAASTLSVRVAASFGADPYAAVVSGLGAIGGTRHGGASVEVHRMLQAAEREGGPAAVGASLERSPSLPGFGMGLYPAGDPRGRCLLERLEAVPAGGHRWRTVASVIDAVRGRDVPPPSCDFGLGALAYLLGWGAEAGEAVFILARAAGWLAHAAEEYSSRTSFRVRAAYTGLRPEPGA